MFPSNDDLPWAVKKLLNDAAQSEFCTAANAAARAGGSFEESLRAGWDAVSRIYKPNPGGRRLLWVRK